MSSCGERVFDLAVEAGPTHVNATHCEEGSRRGHVDGTACKREKQNESGE